jgi:hypothetical protein
VHGRRGKPPLSRSLPDPITLLTISLLIVPTHFPQQGIEIKLSSTTAARDSLPIDRFTECHLKDARFEQFNYFLRKKIPIFCNSQNLNID